MEQIEKDAFLAHSKLPSFKKKIDRAKRFVKDAFQVSTTPYAAISGGKDSIAMLTLVDEVAITLNRDYIIWAHLSDASFPETEATIRTASELCKKGQLILDYSAVSAFEVLKSRDSVQQFGKTGVFFDAIKQFEKCQKTDLAFIGVRASESHRRRKASKIHGHLFHSSVTTPKIVCHPIVWLSVDDVLALILSRGFPLHPIYYKKHPEGVRAIRLGYLTSQDLLNVGTMGFIKANYPEQYQQIIEAKPELSAYA